MRGREDDACPRIFRGRIGTVVGYAGGSGCFVRFDDGFEEFTYAKTVWLESIEKIKAVDSKP